MKDALTGDARHPQPVPVDLEGIETTHPDPESLEHLLSITEVLETVRTQVTRAAAQLVTGPTAVNVNVTDVHGPFDPVAPEAVEAEAAHSDSEFDPSEQHR